MTLDARPVPLDDPSFDLLGPIGAADAVLPARDSDADRPLTPGR